jgi:hypothetical protein
LENRRAEHALYRHGRMRPSGSGEVEGKDCSRVNIVQILIHMYLNIKMIPVETILGMEGGGMLENSGGSKFKYNIFDTF